MSALEQGLVLRHQQVARDLFELELHAPLIAQKAQPGQFIQVKTADQYDPLLRRPISIYDADKQSGSITLLYKVVGKGTRIMTAVQNQEAFDLMGPLGKGFSLPEQASKAILVGGGVGMAPLVYLARTLLAKQCSVTVLYGTGSYEELAAGERLAAMGVDLKPATMDGSAGYKGLVTDLLKTLPAKEFDIIYTCGPEIMMAAVADYAAANNIWGECSLEEHMACGVGACLGCARKLKSDDAGYVKVCKDGPVFNLQAVQLNSGEVPA